MAWTFISAIILLVLKYVFCGFSFWILTDSVAVLLFVLRAVGATFKIKVLAILHGVSIAIWLLWTFMFGGWELWPKMLIYLGLSVVTCAIMLYEDFAFVIVEKDERNVDNDDDSNS